MSGLKVLFMWICSNSLDTAFFSLSLNYFSPLSRDTFVIEWCITEAERYLYSRFQFFFICSIPYKSCVDGVRVLGWNHSSSGISSSPSTSSPSPLYSGSASLLSSCYFSGCISSVSYEDCGVYSAVPPLFSNVPNSIVYSVSYSDSVCFQCHQVPLVTASVTDSAYFSVSFAKCPLLLILWHGMHGFKKIATKSFHRKPGEDQKLHVKQSISQMHGLDQIIIWSYIYIVYAN